MTVKCLSGVDKSSIVFQFTQLGTDPSSLSYEYKVSRRTIIRVLSEYGIDARVRQRAPKLIPQQQQTPLELVAPKETWLTKAKNLWNWLNQPVQFAHFGKSR